MSPKTATPALALILASLTLTLASAATDVGLFRSFNSPSEVLEHFDLPGGLFPANVASFHVVTLQDGERVRLTIHFNHACNVTRPFCVDIPVHFCIETDRVECDETISAIVSWRHLSAVHGVKVYKLFPGPTKTMQISEAVVSNLTPIGPKALQFISSDGELSPKFPVVLIPKDPPACDAQEKNQGFILLPA